MTRGWTTFAEVMAGVVRLGGAAEDRAMRLDLRVSVPGLLRLRGDNRGRLTGRVFVPGLVDDHGATGMIRIAPFAARQIRYRMDFITVAGEPLRLDGWKTVTFRRPVWSMTTLPVTLYDSAGTVAGAGVLRFDLRGDLLRFLAGFRYSRGSLKEARVD